MPFRLIAYNPVHNHKMFLGDFTNEMKFNVKADVIEKYNVHRILQGELPVICQQEPESMTDIIAQNVAITLEQNQFVPKPFGSSILGEIQQHQTSALIQEKPKFKVSSQIKSTVEDILDIRFLEKSDA